MTIDDLDHEGRILRRVTFRPQQILRETHEPDYSAVPSGLWKELLSKQPALVRYTLVARMDDEISVEEFDEPLVERRPEPAARPARRITLEDLP